MEGVTFSTRHISHAQQSGREILILCDRLCGESVDYASQVCLKHEVLKIHANDSTLWKVSDMMVTFDSIRSLHYRSISWSFITNDVLSSGFTTQEEGELSYSKIFETFKTNTPFFKINLKNLISRQIRREDRWRKGTSKYKIASRRDKEEEQCTCLSWFSRQSLVTYVQLFSNYCKNFSL